MNEIASTIERLARDVLIQSDRDIGGQLIDARRSLIADYGFDSVALIKLLLALESAFNIQISDDDLSIDNFDSLIAIEELLEREYQIARIQPTD